MSVTKKMVADKLTEILGRNRMRRNPKADGSCLYTSRDGRRHCIAGQVDVELTGSTYPATVISPIQTLLKRDREKGYTPAAIELLQQAQFVADGGMVNDPESGEMLYPVSGPRRWDEVERILRQLRWLRVTDTHLPTEGEG